MAQVSFVIQGPFIWPTTADLIARLRSLPFDAEIVLSCWQAPDQPQPVETLVTPCDPGALAGEGEAWFNNINRLIVSTREGIKAATSSHVVKLRSDSVVCRADAFTDLVQRCLQDQSCRIHYTIYHGHYPFYPYFISDHLQLGLKTKLLELWDIPLATIEDRQYFSGVSIKPTILRYGTERFIARWHSEQYLCQHLMRRFGHDFPENREHVSLIDLVNSYRRLPRYFSVSSRFASGVQSMKYPNIDRGWRDTAYADLAEWASRRGWCQLLLVFALTAAYLLYDTKRRSRRFINA